MSPKKIAAEVVKRHPELKNFTPTQLRLVKKAITEAVTILSREVLSLEETRETFRKRVPDSGSPSAALRAYRKRLDLTQRELSLKCGILQPHIAAMESGKRSIGPSAAKRLGLVLGVDYRKLL